MGWILTDSKTLARKGTGATMKVTTKIFGEIEIADDKIIVFEKQDHRLPGAKEICAAP